MAKFDMIANHKRGFLNSTLGNAFRGGLTGGLVFGGIAALATLATGGLALPVIAAAAGAGAALFGTLNAVGGAARWGMEFLGGVVGMNRVQRNRGNEYGEPGQEQQRGMGLAEGVVTLVGAAMGLQSMKQKLAGIAGTGKGESQGQQQSAPQQGAPSYGRQPSAFMPPQMPEILADKMKDGKLNLTKEDLANPMLRDAVVGFGQQQVAYRDALVNSGNRQMMEQARELNSRALEYPGYQEKTETFSLSPEHLMDKNIVKHINSDGERREKQNVKEQKAFAREIEREGRDVSRGRYETQFVDPAQQAAQQAREEQTESVHAAEKKGMESARASIRESNVSVGDEANHFTSGAHQAEQKPVIEQKQGSSLLVSNTANVHEAAKAAASVLKDSGAKHVGDAQVARAGSNTGQQRPQDQGRAQG